MMVVLPESETVKEDTVPAAGIVVSQAVIVVLGVQADETEL
jgi:hypothetical protein